MDGPIVEQLNSLLNERTKYSWTFGLARTEPAVGTSARSVLAESYALLKQNFPRDNTCEEIEQWLAGSNDSIAVHLSRNGIVVGTALLRVSGDLLMLPYLCASPRRSGLGALMVRCVEALVKLIDNRADPLCVQALNSSTGFWKRVGFEEQPATTTTTTAQRSLELNYIDTVLMHPVESQNTTQELLLEAIANAEQSLIAREAAIHGAMTKLSKYSYKQLANAMKQQHGGSMNPEGCRVRRRDRQSRQVVLGRVVEFDQELCQYTVCWNNQELTECVRECLKSHRAVDQIIVVE